VVARLLFLASAAFVLWRNTQVGVLVDISWILNNATRIALGDVPYRDFPLAQAPGEFLVQAILIKVFGAHYAVQIFYASLCGGTATVLAHFIARRVLSGAVPSAAALATILTLPLIPLGIYAILPNPFYDPDACLAVLGAVALLFVARERPDALRFVIAGVVATLPLAIKQNIGGPFLISFVSVLALEAVTRPSRRRELRWIGLGMTGALAIGVILLQLFVGVDAYLRGTVTFALAGRGVSLERVQDFAEPGVLWTTALVAILAIGGPRLPERTRAIFAVVAVVLLAASLVPASFMGPSILFPSFLLAAAALGIVRASREKPNFELLLPVVLLATTLGALESAGITASTYGIFPLLSLALACVVRDLAHVVPRPLRLAPYAGAIVALVLVGFGAVYTLENVRLKFVDVNAPGPVMTSKFPSLAGLSARGPYLADLDAMLFWVRDHVPPGDGFVVLPGEDPVYYALERRPALPSVFFYFGDVATPYTPAELARAADEIGVRWVIVKDRLQTVEVPPLEPDLVSRLTDHATLVATVGPYRVFRR
jgi:hypothetical protein